MTDLVSLNASGNTVCTSLMVAEKFGKEHFNVLRDIRELLDKASKDFTDFNFECSSYTDSTGRSLPMYEMTRDGFTLLAMGFTGEEALKWKIEFINAFNAMEAELLKQQINKPADASFDCVALLVQIFADAKIEGNQRAIALDKIFRRERGYSALEATNTQLISPQQQQLYTPSKIGRQLEPPLSSIKVNKLLAQMGWQIKVDKEWEAIGEGEAHAVYLDTGKQHSDGTPVRQLKWAADVIFALQGFINKVDNPTE